MANRTDKHPNFDYCELTLPKKLRPGTFFHAMGDVCLYIGVGGYRGIEYVERTETPTAGTDRTPRNAGTHEVVVHYPAAHLFNHFYQGEWRITCFEENPWPIKRFITNTEAMFTMKRDCGLDDAEKE